MSSTVRSVAARIGQICASEAGTREGPMASAWAKRAGRLSAAVGASISAGVAVTAFCAESKDMSAGVGFDPEALERGAKALREINKSPFAKKALDLSRQQEITKQTEHKQKEAEMQAAAQQYSIEREKVHWNEQKKLSQQQAQQKAQIAQYEDELSRKRMELEHEKQRQRNAEMVAMQEEGSRRMEAEKIQTEQRIQSERRATEKYRSELEKEQVKEKALAEAEGRIKERRLNEDINRRELILQAQQAKDKAIEVSKTILTSLGSAANDLLGDQTKMGMLVGGISVMALGVYGAREGTRVAARAMDRWLGTPSLVRETSRGTLLGGLRKMVGSGAKEEVYSMNDLVLNDTLKTRVSSMSGNLLLTKQRGAPFRHSLFYGPPGTGKTMAAKIMARQSGLDYAILTGGDVAPLGGGAVTQLHSLFDWAQRSRKGLVLFIDEADAFLGRRGGDVTQTEGLRAALNALLYHTGDQSRHFSMILATNRPGDLDPAVLNRVDDAMEFGSPGEAERRQLLGLYMDRYVIKDPVVKNAAMKIDIGKKKLDTLLAEAAAKTEGFSGREIAKLVAAVQAAVYGSVQGALTEAILKDVVDYKVAEHEKRKQL